MSSGFKGGASRVSIPSGVRKTIENIKEITGQNHNDYDIYAMLKECSMDPNETTQKLLLLDTFHEVKRKRDKRKENLNKEPVESKWKPGLQTRENRVGRVNYSSRYTSQDAGGGRNLAAVKENTSTHFIGKGTSKIPLTTPQEMRKNEASSASPTTVVSNAPSGIVSASNNVMHENHASAGKGVKKSNTTSVVSIKNPNAMRNRGLKQHQRLELRNRESSFPSPPAQESYTSPSDTVSLPSQDLRIPVAVDTNQHELGTRHAPTELLDDNPTEGDPTSAKISASEVVATDFEQKAPNDYQEFGNNQHLESKQTAPSTVNRPSSNHNNRSQLTGSAKVGPAKEWKPKSINPNIGLSGTTAGTSEVAPQATPVIASKETTLELQSKFEETHISDSQHVIIPNHLHVPEVEKLGFCFGSFDANFELNMNQNGVPGSEKSPLLSESSEPIDGAVKDLQLSTLAAPEDTETKHPDLPKSPPQGPENFPANEAEASLAVGIDHSEPKHEVAPGSHQVHTSPNYSYAFMPPILGGQLPPSESSESQTRDASRLLGVVPQSFDPASYYAQFYRPSLDNDGRISPFHTAGATNKYNGNTALVSSQTSQEGGVPMVLSTSQTPLITQSTGVMHSSVIPTQQTLPIFRQPTGLHLPNYPPNCIPYGHYFPPFYVPPPAIHQFLSNGAFPQQPQAASIYPTNAKYSVSQYKQGPNTSSMTHIGVPGNYAPYGLSMPNYTSGSATPAVTSTSNEDTVPPQVKENNVYANGQQIENPGVWFTTPSRDISALQASSFYNLPQGQLAFATSQPGHGPYPGLFHPSQAMTSANGHHPISQQSQGIPSNSSDTVGPTAAGVYQQQQHTQLNWPSNY